MLTTMGKEEIMGQGEVSVQRTWAGRNAAPGRESRRGGTTMQ